jgi:hypothetical protein
MRLIAIVAVLALTASPALACGSGAVSASGNPLKTAAPGKSELKRHASKAEEADMLKQGYVKSYTRCGSGSFIWVKKG